VTLESNGSLVTQTEGKIPLRTQVKVKNNIKMDLRE
jgi:hypothetical protein